MFSIKVKTKDFLKSIKIVENAIEDDKLDNSKNSIYIETKGNKLEFRVVGFSLSVKCECEANIISQGSIMIKHKLIEEFLRKVNDEEIEIRSENNTVKVITTDSIANYSLIEDDKPMDLGNVNGVKYRFNKKTLVENIENSKFAVSTDSSKTIINCIKFDVEENILKLVATDSYRLVYKEVDILENLTNENISVNIPLKTIDALLRIFKETSADEIIFKSEGTRVLFKLNDVEIITKVVEIQFPDYVNLLKNVKTTKKVLVNKADFQTVLEKVLIFVKDKKERKDVAEFVYKENELKISGDSEYGNASSRILVDKNFDDMKIYLNIKFLLEYLNTIKNSKIIEIDMHDEVSAVLLKEESSENNNVYLTMPLKI